MRRFVLVGLLTLVSVAAHAQTFTLPVNIGGSGSAKAADVGADLQAIATAINALMARASKLEGNIVAADLAGTYALNGLQNEIGGANTTGAHVGASTFYGIVTLTSDGNATFSNARAGTQVNLGSMPFQSQPAAGNGPTSGVFQWTYANGVLSALGGSFSVAAGGRLMIRTSSNDFSDDGTSVLLILSRLK